MQSTNEDMIESEFSELNQAITKAIESQSEIDNEDYSLQDYYTKFGVKTNTPTEQELYCENKASCSSYQNQTEYGSLHSINKRSALLHHNYAHSFPPSMIANDCNCSQIGFSRDNRHYCSFNFYKVYCRLLDNPIKKENKKDKINQRNQAYTTPQHNSQSKFDWSSNNSINDTKIEEDKIKTNIISLAEIIKGNDNRTTIMIRNIPNKYTLNTFLKQVNLEFFYKYDLFYLPIDYDKKNNFGFAFINFVDPMHIVDFYNTYRGRKWNRFYSGKICELVYAKIQGRRELISHFKKAKILSLDSEDKRPVIFRTPFPLPKILIPIPMLNMFRAYYPYALYHPISNEKVAIDSFMTY